VKEVIADPKTENVWVTFDIAQNARTGAARRHFAQRLQAGADAVDASLCEARS
jgi:hypothetical protein